MTNFPNCTVGETPEPLTETPTATPLPGLVTGFRPSSHGAHLDPSSASAFRTSDWDRPNCRAICDGLTPALKAAEALPLHDTGSRCDPHRLGSRPGTPNTAAGHNPNTYSIDAAE
jgi:hypothetical protein